MGLLTTPRTWAPGETPTAGMFNTEIRDAIAGLQAAWDTYTPTWTATGTAPAINNGTMTGRYRRIGQTVDFTIDFLTGSTTTYGSGSQRLSLPVTARSAGPNIVFVGMFLDASLSDKYELLGNLLTTTTVELLVAGTTVGGPLRGLGASVPVAMAVNDRITLSGRYEAA